MGMKYLVHCSHNIRIDEKCSSNYSEGALGDSVDYDRRFLWIF